MKVTFHGHILAQSNDTIIVENNHYFPPSSVRKSLFSDSDTSTASYYNATVDGKAVKDVAWYYPSTITDKAKPIEGYVAFYKNKVTIQSDDE